MPLWHCIYSCFCREVWEYASIGVKKWAKLCAVSLVCVYFCVKREYILHSLRNIQASLILFRSFVTIFVKVII